jgi:hypothetical protein
LEVDIDLPNYYLLGHLVVKTKIISHVNIITQEIMAPTVFAYNDPDVPATERDIKLEHVSLGNTHIAHSLNKVSLALDLSDIKSPVNSIFMHLSMDMNRLVTAQMETIGLKAPPISLKKIQFMTAFE